MAHIFLCLHISDNSYCMLDIVQKRTVNNIYPKKFLSTFSIRLLVWKAESIESLDLLSLGFVEVN